MSSLGEAFSGLSIRPWVSLRLHPVYVCCYMLKDGCLESHDWRGFSGNVPEKCSPAGVQRNPRTHTFGNPNPRNTLRFQATRAAHIFLSRSLFVEIRKEHANRIPNALRVFQCFAGLICNLRAIGLQFGNQSVDIAGVEHQCAGLVYVEG